MVLKPLPISLVLGRLTTSRGVVMFSNMKAAPVMNARHVLERCAGLENTMKTVTFAVSSPDGLMRRAKAAFRGEKQGARVSFASPELLFALLTPKRWELIRAMAGAGPMSIREVARRVARDVKAVHGDVHALLDAGVLQRSDDGRVVFPFDAVHVDFVMRAA
jgi:predicted transcriptional regulator